jgi:hypothetical protein
MLDCYGSLYSNVEAFFSLICFEESSVLNLKKDRGTSMLERVGSGALFLILLKHY